MGTRIAGVTAVLPSHLLSSAEVEQGVAVASSGFVPPSGLIERLTGIRHRHRMADTDQASDLAVAAAGKLLAASGVTIADVDLLIFASASQDMVEPATAHIVAAKLGAGCPVMDVKNACNSVLNAIEVADALVTTGRYRRVLIATGESPSRAVRWNVPDLAGYLRSFPGYTLSDGGSAVLLDGEGRPAEGILATAFTADSRHWPAGMLRTGGSAFPRDPEASYLTMDGTALKNAFLGLGPELLHRTLSEQGLGWEDLAVVCVHQVSDPYLHVFADGAGVPHDKLVRILAEHGNVASASLPLQLSTAMDMGRCGPGDLVALVGLAAGVSMGVVLVRL